ncbi:hypothetical protein CRG98_028157 [Punica granatum]|uniref:Kinetochore protein Spc24 n=1 Tax=Punica granatum TaxID=22663 RepID=A0A2I0J6V5_PUNGR|nr:hypothetical protein CRG98_028157 [Punica granatum]
MGDSSRKIDMGKLVTYSDDLARVLRDKKDSNNLAHCHQHLQALRSSCDADSSELQSLLRAVTDEIDDLDCQRASIEDKKHILKKLEQYDLRQQMTLSMYASVTNIIPNLDDDSKIGGYIVDREKKVVDKFEFNSMEMPAYDARSKIWKMIDIL